MKKILSILLTAAMLFPSAVHASNLNLPNVPAGLSEKLNLFVSGDAEMEEFRLASPNTYEFIMRYVPQ